MSTEKNRWPNYATLLLVGLLVLGYFFVPSVTEFFDEAWQVLTSGDRERMGEWVQQFGFWGPLVLVLAMVVQMFLIVVPTILLMVVAILAYGPFWGSLIVFAAVFVASSVGYVIGKHLGHNAVAKLLGEQSEQKVEHFLEDYGFWAVVITRLNPFLSNDAISFVGGLLNMGYWKFIGATLLGIAPLTLFIAIFGESIEDLKTGLLWGSLVCLVLFGLYVWWDKKRAKA